MAGVGKIELASPISTSEFFFSLGEEDILAREFEERKVWEKKRCVKNEE